MLENNQNSKKKEGKYSEVADKVVHLFGWKKTYEVEKLQRRLTFYDAHYRTKLSSIESTFLNLGGSSNLDFSRCGTERSQKKHKKDQLRKSYERWPFREVSK